MDNVNIDYTPCPRCEARELDLKVVELVSEHKVRNFGERWPSTRTTTRSTVVVVCQVCGLQMPVLSSSQ